MAAKVIQISTDSGSTWNTLPGDQGQLDFQMSQVQDTIFGADYQSSEAGVGSFTAQANAFYKGYPGFKASIKKGGTSTAFTGEAMNQVGTSQTYQIGTASMNLWDHTVAPTIYDNGSAVAATDIASIDYLFGRVTFAAAYSVTGPVTADGSYLPLQDLGKANDYTLTQTAATKDISSFSTMATNGGYQNYDPGLKTVSLQLKGFYDSTSALVTSLNNRDILLIEINPDGADLSRARGFFMATNHTQSGNVGAVEAEDATFQLYVPEGVSPPFEWDFAAGSTMSQAVQDVLNAFANDTKPMLQYLYDGVSGFNGTVVVTEATVAGSMTGMNQFTLKFQGDGAAATV